MKTRTKIAALGAAVALSLGFGMAPASATTETGHTAGVPVTAGADFQVRIVWNTSYNSVGTSSTEPMTLQGRQTSSSPTGAAFAKSFRITFRKANGGSPVTKNFNCYLLPPFDTTWNSCDLGAWANIQLADAPTVVITLWEQNNQTAHKFGPVTYQYK